MRTIVLAIVVVAAAALTIVRGAHCALAERVESHVGTGSEKHV